MGRVVEEEWSRPLPLLQFQLAALLVWLVGLEFWSLFAFVSASSFSIAWIASWRLFSLLRLAIKVSLLHAALLVLRHQFFRVRVVVFSKFVSTSRAVLLYLPVHLLHGAAGWLICKWLFETLGLNPTWPTTCGVVSGLVFSLAFFLQDRNTLRFPTLTRRRISKVRSGFLSAVVRAAVLAVLSVSLLFGLQRHWKVLGDEMNVSGCWLVSWTVMLTSEVCAVLHEVFMTENKPIRMCTRSNLDDEEEAELLAEVVATADEGSLEEALLSFPLSVTASKDLFLAFKSTEKDRGVKSFKTESSLMVFAKANEMLILDKLESKKKKNDSPVVDLQDGLTPHEQDLASVREEAARQLQHWWVQTCDLRISKSAMSEPWEQLSDLRERRFDAVLQALYSADAIKPGYAFWNRGKLSSSREIARARAFMDLVTLSEFSESRRRIIFENRKAWFKLFEVCTAVVDSLSIVLKVATEYSALEPTIPVSSKGQSLLDVFVLGQGSQDSDASDARQRRHVAWQAEFASRKLRRQPWVSLEWWTSVFVSPFRELDPIATQFSLEFEESQIRAVTPGPLTSSAEERKERGGRSEPHRFAWEQQWKRQQAAQSWRWVSGIRNVFYRTPMEQTSALFAESHNICCSAIFLGNMISKSLVEDQFGNVTWTVPVVLNSLLTCMLAIERYVKSSAFLGSVDPPAELEGNQLARKETMQVYFTLERAVFAITTTFHERLSSFRFSTDQAELLSRIVNFET